MDIVGKNNTLCREVEPRDFGMSGRSEGAICNKYFLQRLLSGGESQQTLRAKFATCLPVVRKSECVVRFDCWEISGP